MKSKYIVAIVAAGLIGSSMAAYGPAPKAGKGCSKAIVSDQVGNSVRSGVKSGVCWNDRITFSGVMSGRYTYTDSDALEAGSTLDNEMRLNHFALIADAQLDSKWTAHVTVADVHLETSADDAASTNDLRVDEAMLYYKGDMPFDFKAGYGFANFGEYNNPYDFVRNPTDVLATNQDAMVAAGFQIQDGLYGEVYAIGDTELGWGAALGYDNQVGDVGMHSKFSYVDNKDLGSVTYTHGGTMDLEVAFALPSGVKVGGAYVKSRSVDGSQDAIRMWSLDAAYRFSAAGMPSDLHGWYASNKETTTNRIVNDGTGATYTDRFNLMKYDSSRLDNIWSVGYGVQLSPNVDVSLDYVSSDGTNDDASAAGREEISDFSMFNVSLTGRF